MPTDAAKAEQRFVAACEAKDLPELKKLALERDAKGDKVGAERVVDTAAELGDGGDAYEALARQREGAGDVADARRLRGKLGQD